MTREFQCSLCYSRDVPKHPRKRDLCEDCVPSLEARGLAWCTRGKHRVGVADLSPGKTWCRPCERARIVSNKRDNREYAKAWRAAHPEKAAEYRAAKPELYRAARRRSYWKDIEHTRAYARAQYRKHHDKKLTYMHQWRAQNRTHIQTLRRRYYQRAKLRAWGLL